MGGPFRKALSSPSSLQWSMCWIQNIQWYFELGLERWQGEGEKSGNKQREADSTSNAVESCKELLATMRE